MKNNHLFYETLKFQLLLCCCFLVLFLTSVFSWLLYSSAKEKYEREVRESALVLHANANYSMESNMAQIHALNTALSTNTKITSFLSDDGTDRIRNLSAALEALAETKMLLNTTSISAYVPKMMVSSDQSKKNLQIGFFYGQVTDLAAFESLYRETPAENRFLYPIAGNPFHPEFYKQYKPEQILPLQLPVNSYATSQKIGTLYLALDTAILSAPLKGLENPFILLENRLYQVENGSFTPLDFDLGNLEHLASDAYLISDEYQELSNGTVFISKSKSGIILISPLKTFGNDLSLPDLNMVLPAFFLVSPWWSSITSC